PRDLFRPHGLRRLVRRQAADGSGRGTYSRFVTLPVRIYGQRNHPRALRADAQSRAVATMCRWAAYLGEEVFLEDIVTAPCHSLIAQSHRAIEGKSPTNGDGFGLAWYGQRPEPGLYRDILPAW